MAFTNFALLTNEQKTAWAMETLSEARNYSFLTRFTGTDSNSMVQRVTELKKSAKGARAVITLVNDLQGDGVAGDRTVMGMAEALRSSDQVIRIDQLRNVVENEGRVADQKSIIDFRKVAKDQLAYWLADRTDQMAFLALSGVSFAMTTNGVARVGSDLPYLEFAADVSAPTSRRAFRWDQTNKILTSGGTTAVTSADLPSWELFVQLKAKAKNEYIRGINNGGEETYHAFLTPSAMARLKLDSTFMQNLRHADSRGSDNALFTGSSVKIDGIVFHEYRHVYNTSAAVSGSGKWGSGANVDGCQILFCGAQALAVAEIGEANWEEETQDLGNRSVIGLGRMFGLLKTKFMSTASGSVQDFGVISAYVAQ